MSDLYQIDGETYTLQEIEAIAIKAIKEAKAIERELEACHQEMNNNPSSFYLQGRLDTLKAIKRGREWRA